ncbi:MAG: proton-conducting transporter membrane subunit, partial [Phycisphaerales bacterium]
MDLNLSSQLMALMLGVQEHAGDAHEITHGGGVASGPWWAILIPGMPILGAIACVMLAMVRDKTKAPAWVSVGCLGVSFLATVALWLTNDGTAVTTSFEWINLHWGSEPGQSFIANWGFYLDSLTLLWMLFVTGLGTLIALYASEYMEHDLGAGYCRFFFAFCLFVFSMSCLVMADNLILLYLGWEGVGLCSYLLIGYFYK